MSTSAVLPSWSPKPLSPGEPAPRKKSSPGDGKAKSKKGKKRSKRDETIRMAVVALLITAVAIVGGVLGFRAGAMLGPATPSAAPTGTSASASAR